MKHARLFVLILLLFLMSCSPNQSLAETPTASPSLEPTTEAQAFPLQETQIVIDGVMDDWLPYEAAFSDPQGDQLEGFADFGELRVFANQDAIYAMVRFHEEGVFDHIIFHFKSDTGITYQFNAWTSGIAQISRGAGGESEPIPIEIASGEVVELKVSLESFGLCPVQIERIELCCGEAGVRADVIHGGELAYVAEVDPSEPLATIEIAREDELAKTFHLAESLLADELIEGQFPGGLITQSESGIIYYQSLDTIPPSVGIFDQDSGDLHKVIDLPEGTGIGRLFGGPGNSVYLAVGAEVRQIFPDGSYDIWGAVPLGFPQAMTNDGGLIGTSDLHDLVEFFPNGSIRTIADGFSHIFITSPADDGSVIVLDIGAGEVVRVFQDGSRRLLFEGRPRGETNEAGMGPDGDFYLNLLDKMWQFNIESGRITAHRSILPICAFQVQSFTFIDNETILTTGDHLVLANLAEGDNTVLIQNDTLAFATDIGPDDMFYYGMPGCNANEGTSTIYRVNDQGAREVVLEEIPGTIQDLVFDKDGGVFVYLYDGSERQILYYPSFEDEGVPVPISSSLRFTTIAAHPHSGNLFIGTRNGTGIWEYSLDGLENRTTLNLPYDINWFHIDFSPDGMLYALATDARWAERGRTDRWVLRINLQEGTHALVGETSRNHPGGTYDVMDVDFEGNIWVLANPERRIFKVSPDGEVTIFADGVPIDNMAISVDREGDVYFTAMSAIFRIYQAESN